MSSAGVFFSIDLCEIFREILFQYTWVASGIEIATSEDSFAILEGST